MQKKIIVLAIASALTAPALALAADVTVYGQMNLSVDSINSGQTNNSSTAQNLSSNSSRVGVKSTEDLGGGLSVVAQLEAAVAGDSSSGAPTGQFFNRNTYLGLSGAEWGTVLAGIYDTPYKMADRRLDMFGDGIADNRGNQSTGTFTGVPAFGMMGGTGASGAFTADLRASNVLAYMSPNMSGFTVAVATIFGAENATSGATKGKAYSLAGMYEQGPIYADLAYQQVELGTAGSGSLGAGTSGPQSGDKLKSYKIGGGYTMDQFTLGLVVERMSYNIQGGSSYSNTNYYIGGKYSIDAANAVKLAYTKRGEQSGLNDAASQATIGFDHMMSKATTVYALYTKYTQDVTVATPPAAPFVAGTDADPSIFSLGMKHSF